MKTTRAFKSGNSVAVRLPKAFGVTEGAELVLREEMGRYVIERVEAPRKMIDLTGIYGACPDIEPIGDRTIEDRPSEIEERLRRGS